MPQSTRLLEVGMNRAMKCLRVTASKGNELRHELLATSADA
jgi:hypothetical protein